MLPRRIGGLGLAAGVLLAVLLTACTAGHSTQPPPTTTPTPTARPVGSFTLAATGDLLVHTAVAEQAKRYGAKTGAAYDFRPMLTPVQGALSAADPAVCHLETPLSADDRRISGYPTFNTPHELAAAIGAAGYDSCSLASNHAMDQGPQGVAATLAALDGVGVGHAGTARSAAEASRPELHLVNGVQVGLLAYTYGVERRRPPARRPALAGQHHRPSAHPGRRARGQAGRAQFVAVSLHWGTQYQVAPTAEQRTLARMLLASPDIDLLIGSHVHVVQPIERIGGKYVLYGLGNLLSNQSARCCPAATQDGVIALVDVQRHGSRFVAAQVRYTPTWVEPSTYRVLVVAAALADPATPAAERAALAASWRQTVAAVSLLGPSASAARPDHTPRSSIR